MKEVLVVVLVLDLMTCYNYFQLGNSPHQFGWSWLEWFAFLRSCAARHCWNQAVGYVNSFTLMFMLQVSDSPYCFSDADSQHVQYSEKMFSYVWISSSSKIMWACPSNAIGQFYLNIWLLNFTAVKGTQCNHLESKLYSATSHTLIRIINRQHHPPLNKKHSKVTVFLWIYSEGWTENRICIHSFWFIWGPELQPGSPVHKVQLWTWGRTGIMERKEVEKWEVWLIYISRSMY